MYNVHGLRFSRRSIIKTSIATQPDWFIKIAATSNRSVCLYRLLGMSGFSPHSKSICIH